MAPIDLDTKREALAKHFESYWEKRLAETEGKKLFADAHVTKWKAIYEKLLQDDRFVHLAEPVTPETRLRTSEYCMRYDGVHIFPESVQRDDGGRFVLNANPMRLPYDPEAPVEKPYICDRTERIFGVPVRTLTTVKNAEGKKDHDAQVAESERIIHNQRNSNCPIAPFLYGRPVTEACYFYPEDLLVHFSFQTAMDYMYNVAAFEPIVKGVDWMLQKAARKPYAPFDEVRFEQLGATGSASFGDEEDKEDFDVVFLGSPEFLAQVRDFLYDGTRSGDFRPFMSNYKRRLRVCNRELPIECTGGELIFCTFFSIAPVEADPLYGLKIKHLAPIEYFEALVKDDTYNMVSPTMVTLCEFSQVRGEGLPADADALPMIINHGGSRGQFVTGNWVRVSNAHLVEVEPLEGETYRAILVTGWFDVDLASW